MRRKPINRTPQRGEVFFHSGTPPARREMGRQIFIIGPHDPFDPIIERILPDLAAHRVNLPDLPSY